MREQNPTRWRRDPFFDDVETIYTEERVEQFGKPEVEAARAYHAACVLQERGNRSRRCIAWFNLFAILVLAAGFVCCMWESGCLGGR